MSKLNKNIQETMAWRKKHEAETLNFQALDKALATWQAKVAQIEASKAKLAEAQQAAIDARKAVAAELKRLKATRKEPAPVKAPVAKTVAKTPAKPVAIAAPAKKVAAKKPAPGAKA